jgi:hypothetical protein
VVECRARNERGVSRPSQSEEELDEDFVVVDVDFEESDVELEEDDESEDVLADDDAAAGSEDDVVERLSLR